MKNFDQEVVECVFDESMSEEDKNKRIESARLTAKQNLQKMIYKEINNAIYSKDDCIVYCSFDETEIFKRSKYDTLLAKDFIYYFTIVKNLADANFYLNLAEHKYFDRSISLEKQNEGVYKVPYKFLKFLQETSTLNFHGSDS